MTLVVESTGSGEMHLPLPFVFTILEFTKEAHEAYAERKGCLLNAEFKIQNDSKPERGTERMQNLKKG